MLLSAEQKAVMPSLDQCQAFCDKTIHAVATMFDPKDSGQQKHSGDQINKAYYLQAADPVAYAVHEIPSTTGVCESVRSRFTKVQVSVTADRVQN